MAYTEAQVSKMTANELAEFLSPLSTDSEVRLALAVMWGCDQTTVTDDDVFSAKHSKGSFMGTSQAPLSDTFFDLHI